MQIKSLSRTAAVLLLTVTVFALSAFAQHAGKGKANHDDGIDNGAQTDLRALTTDEISALVASMKNNLSQSAEGLQVKRTPNGMMVDLQDRFQDVFLAKIGPDGKVATACVDNAPDAKRFLSSKPTDKKTEQKKPYDPNDVSTWEEK